MTPRATIILVVALAVLIATPAMPAEPEDDLTTLIRALSATRRTPEGIAPLDRLEADLAYWPGGRLRASLDAIVAQKDTDPFVAARISLLLADLERASGRIGEAAGRVAELGLVGAWHVAGPVGVNGDCQSALPPTDGWTDTGRLMAGGPLHFDSVMWPTDSGAAFAAVHFASRKQKTVLRLGADGPVRVWVDGAQVADAPDLAELRPDQVAVALTVPPGLHTVVVRVCLRDERSTALMARFTDPVGRPDGNVTILAEPPARTSSGRPATLSGATVADPTRWWIQRAQSARSSAERRDVARVLANAGRELPPELAPAALLEDDADALMERAMLEREGHRRIELLQLVLDREGERVRAMQELAELQIGRQRYLAARALLDEADQRAPGQARTAVLSARILAENQIGGEATRLLEDAARAHPDVPAVLHALGSHAYQQGNIALARRSFDALADVAINATEAGFWRFEVARLQGRVDDAVAAADLMITGRPDLGGHRLMKARYLVDVERADEAEAVLSAIPAPLRSSPDLIEGIGRLEQRLGHPERAVALLRQSLAIRPQNPDLRAAIGRLSPDNVRPEDAWLEDPAALAKLPADEGDPDAEYLLDQKIVRMFPNGLSTATYQRIVRINRVGPLDADRSVHVPYDPFRHTVEVVRAEIRRSDGTIRPVTDREEQSLSEAWYGLYYDLRHVIVPFRDLMQGDLLVLEYRVSDVGKNLLADSFNDMTVLKDVIPKRRARYVLLSPASRQVRAELVDPRGETAYSEDSMHQGELLARVFEATDLPALAVEDDMPGYAEVSPYVHVSTFESYQDVARYYAALVAPQRQVTAAMRAHIKTLVSGLDSTLDKVRVVHNDLVRSNRYVGLEFGIHGYKPYPSSQVFERRFGDCKDQSTLLSVMLEEVGIASRLVLVRTRPLGTVPASPASLSVFDHAILYVPELDLWLDPTAEANGIYELPASDQGATALVIEPDGGRFLTLPESDPEDNVRNRELRVAVSPDGSGAIEGRLQTAGLFSPALREMYETPALREKHVEEQLGAFFPGFRLQSANVSGTGDLQAPVSVELVGMAPNLAEVRAGVITLAPPDSADEYVQRLAPTPTREQDLLLDHPFVDRRVERLVAPPGWSPAAAPSADEVQSAFGTFTIRITVDGDAVVRERVLEVRTRRIAQDAYGDWRTFLRKVDALGQVPIAVRRGEARATKDSHGS